MASPYFQPIQTKTADYSGITRGGEAMGRAYADIGKALGSVASTYFQKKKVEAKARQAVSTREGEQILLNAGLDEEDINGLTEDERFKIVKGAIDEVGLENFQNTQMQMQQNRQLVEKNKIALEASDLTLMQAKRAEQKFQRMDEISRHYYRQDPSTGNVAQNLNGFEKWDEYATEVGEFARGRNLKGFSPANFSMFMNSSKIDMTDKNALVLAADKWSAMNNLDATEQKKLQDIAKERHIDPIVVQENLDKFINADPAMEMTFKAQATFDVMASKIDEAFTVDEQGNYTINNTTALMDFRRQLAKNGNGVGVMTDKDVSDYMGETDWKAVLKRTLYQFTDSDEGKSAPLSPEDAKQLHRLFEAAKDFHNKKAGNAIKDGIIAVDRMYPALGRQKILGMVSPYYGKQLDNFGSTNDSLVVNPQQSAAIMREFDTGKTYQQIFDAQQEANPDIPEEQIHQFLQTAVEQEKSVQQSATEQTKTIPKDIENKIRAEVELLGVDNHNEAITAIGGAVATQLGDDLYNSAKRRLNKNHPLNVQIDKDIKSLVQKHFSARARKGSTSMSAVKSAAQQLNIPVIDRNGKPLPDKKIHAQMRKEILKRTMKGTGGLKNFFKRMFASKSAAAKIVGGAGMATVLYDVYAFAKENDGVVESDEVKSIIDRAKSKHPDMPQDFWDEMRRDMLDDIHKRENTSKKDRFHFGR